MIDLSEYKNQLRLDPHTQNTGKWYARSTIHHDGKTYPSGAELPPMTNEQVVQLLDVNAVTSVGPQAAAHVQPATNTQPTGDEFDANGNPVAPSGTTRLDANGNPIQ